MRIYFCGASGVGKTTLAKIAAEASGLPMLESVGRQVTKRWQDAGMAISQILTNPAVCSEFQKEIFAGPAGGGSTGQTICFRSLYRSCRLRRRAGDERMGNRPVRGVENVRRFTVRKRRSAVFRPAVPGGERTGQT
jgi:hypothetical protein